MKKFASIILLACLLILPGAEQKKTAAVLAVGFGPFGGRPANGSWSAANSLKEKVAATLEVPVVWGKPGEMLAAQWEQSRPEIVLCFGEGYPGFFAVEAVARNERKPIKDVNGNLPPADKIEPDGAEIPASAPVLAVAKAMTERGFPTHVSTDAGGYLCNEMLYAAERLKAKHPEIKLVLFVHVPPPGQAAFLPGRAVKSDDELLAAYADNLLAVCRKIVEER
jgi:pyroglutamyl-peptidase